MSLLFTKKVFKKTFKGTWSRDLRPTPPPPTYCLLAPIWSFRGLGNWRIFLLNLQTKFYSILKNHNFLYLSPWAWNYLNTSFRDSASRQQRSTHRLATVSKLAAIYLTYLYRQHTHRRVAHNEQWRQSLLSFSFCHLDGRAYKVTFISRKMKKWQR